MEMFYIYNMKGFLFTAALIFFAVVATGADSFHVRVTNAPFESEYASIAWTGEALGMAWMDGRDGNQEIYFRLFHPDRKALSPETRLTNSNNWDYRPCLVWTGKGFGLAWVHERRFKRDVYFAGLDEHGRMLAGPKRVIEQRMIEKDARLAWTGGGYGLVWQEYRNGGLEIFYLYLDAAGSRSGGDVQLTRSQGMTEPGECLFKDGKFTLAYINSAKGKNSLHFMRFDISGKVENDVMVSEVESACTRPSLAYGDGLFGMAWCDGSDEKKRVFFASVDSNGRLATAPRCLTSDSALKAWADVASCAGGYALAFYSGDRFSRKIYLARLDANGDIEKEPFAITPLRRAETACPVLQIEAIKGALAVAWVDMGENLNSEIYVTTAGF